MFNNSRYVTVGVMTEISLEHQILIWSILDRFLKEKIEVDYLQIIELIIEKDEYGVQQQVIIHRQEVPSYKKKYIISVDNPINEKIFIIDDGNTTMLLASEY